MTRARQPTTTASRASMEPDCDVARATLCMRTRLASGARLKCDEESWRAPLLAFAEGARCSRSKPSKLRAKLARQTPAASLPTIRANSYSDSHSHLKPAATATKANTNNNNHLLLNQVLVKLLALLVAGLVFCWLGAANAQQLSSMTGQLLSPAPQTPPTPPPQHQHPHQHPHQQHLQYRHLAPAAAVSARDRSLNLSHVLVDELTNSIYVGATNYLLQVSAVSLKPEFAVKTGPVAESLHPRDCTPATCVAFASQADVAALPLAHSTGLGGAGDSQHQLPAWAPLQSRGRAASAAGAPAPQHRRGEPLASNYNKLLVADWHARQLIACGSLSQGACRKHQLGKLANFSELVPLSVAANDELSSTVALVTAAASPPASGEQLAQQRALYVAATNTRLGPYRDMPAISARYLEPQRRALQIVEPSFADSARVDISFELRDYYLVNYVYAFQWQESFAYFATVQRKSPLRQLEEFGYETRLARLCLNDPNLQTYVELTLQCQSADGRTNYNLLQDAQLYEPLAGAGSGSGSASSRLQQWRQSPQQASRSALLIGAFARSKDHSTRASAQSAICAFSVERIEQRFAENIQLCYNGTLKSRSMNYIAGSVSDCPKTKSAANDANFCSEPLKLNGSLALAAAPLVALDGELVTAVAATSAPTSAARRHLVLVAGTASGKLKRFVVTSGGRSAAEFDSVQVADATSGDDAPILADLALLPARPLDGADQFAIVATRAKLAKLRINACKAPAPPPAHNRSAAAAFDECSQCAHLADPFCGWCATSSACTGKADCRNGHWLGFEQIKCSDYQPLAPQYVPAPSSGQQQPSEQQFVDVNVNLAPHLAIAGPNAAGKHADAAYKLAHAQFVCTFDFEAGNGQRVHNGSLTTLAAAARLNQHAGVASIGCPLPAPAAKPRSAVKARVRVALAPHVNELHVAYVNKLLGADSALIERHLHLFDCDQHSASCQACTSAGEPQAAQWRRNYQCVWCAGKCVASASSCPPFAEPIVGDGADQGCAPADSSSATPMSANGNLMETPMSSPAQAQSAASANSSTQSGASLRNKQHIVSKAEILVASGARRALALQLPGADLRELLEAHRSRKLECQLEVEGAKMRLQAKLGAESGGLVLVSCQEALVAFKDEIATSKARLSILTADASSLIAEASVLLYKCHLFGVNPALAATQRLAAAALTPSGAPLGSPHQTDAARRPASDCSLCSSIERKFHCAWCNNQCQHSDQCGELPAPTCAPPRIDFIWPTSGPVDGGTLLTIEGSNLGANEREIQDKISVGGEACELVSYSVSTRIVCRVAASARGAQSVPVFVGSKAGVTRANEKFHYKNVHMSDVSPKLGPNSGGTRLFIAGANLNVGSQLQLLLDASPCLVDPSATTANQIVCVTARNLLAETPRATRLTLSIDNATQTLPFAFTYMPDPIITSIEPVESFASGGRLVLVSGEHLMSAQSNQLLVYDELTNQLVNATSCQPRNSTLMTCLTPAIPPQLLQSYIADLASPPPTTTTTNFYDQQLPADTAGLPAESAPAPAPNLRLKMSFALDDVRSARHLDDYYHHLPHTLAYVQDPQLYPLEQSVVDYTPELVIKGANLGIKGVEHDTLITIGARMCPVKALSADTIVCEPPRLAPLASDELGRPSRRQLPQIVALIGSNLRFELGYMRYSQAQILEAQAQFNAINTNKNHNAANNLPFNFNQTNGYNGFDNSQFAWSIQQLAVTELQSQQQPRIGDGEELTASAVFIVALAAVGLATGFGLVASFGLAKYRNCRAEREYKRIQLQMGALDSTKQMICAANGRSFIVDSHQSALPSALNYHMQQQHHHQHQHNQHYNQQNQHYNQNQRRQQSNASRALGLVGKRLFQPFFGASSHCSSGGASFPPSPQTDVSSLAGSNRHSAATATRLVATASRQQRALQAPARQAGNVCSNSSSASSSSTSSSTRVSSAAARRHANNTGSQNNNSSSHQQTLVSRNFQWTQDAPSTIVPYAVIESCNLPFEAKKQFV